MQSFRSCALAIVFMASLSAQIVPPGVSLLQSWSRTSLGVPGPLGGLEFTPDGQTLLVAGQANSGASAAYALPVLRDATGRVTGFGPATVYALTPGADGGLQFGPNGLLFWTQWPSNQLGQVRPGIAPRSDLLPGVVPSTGGMQFVPAGLPNAGDLIVSSFNNGSMFTVPLTPNPDGTFTPGTATLFATLPNGTEGFRTIPSGPSAGSIVFTNYSLGSLSLLRINLATGGPLLLPSGAPDIRPFISGLTNAIGPTFDPLTNDFFVSTYNSSDSIFHFSGFPDAAPITAPLTWSISQANPIDLPIDLGTAYASSLYAVLVGGSGNTPGIPFGQSVIPLNFDIFTQAVLDLSLLGVPPFQGFIGVLDPAGRGLARFNPPAALPPVWAGATIDFCLIATPPEFASLPANVRFVP